MGGSSTGLLPRRVIHLTRCLRTLRARLLRAREGPWSGQPREARTLLARRCLACRALLSLHNPVARAARALARRYTLCERGDRPNLSRARAEIYWFSKPRAARPSGRFGEGKTPQRGEYETFWSVREILSEPPRGADWLALTGGVLAYERVLRTGLANSKRPFYGSGKITC